MTPRLRQLIILMTVGVSLIYLGYRIGFTLNLTSSYAAAISVTLVCAEAFGILSVVMFAIQVWDPREPPMQPPLAGRTVDIFVPTYNEDTTILRATLEACMRLDYAGRRVYLCDDGGTDQRCNHPENGPKARARRAEIEALCAELGVKYLTRPKNEHAKAGNLNHAFTQTDGEFLIIFDADHVPEPHFINRILGYFADPKLGFIQTPHAFYNFNSFQARLDHANRRYWEEGALFYGVIQPGRNRWGCPIFAGSAAMFRREALEQVGYIALETITEDMHTGMRMNAKGWKSLAVSERMVAGQAAPDITTFHTQRLRWGEGNLSIMAYDNPLTMKGLTLAQRLCYFGSMAHWAGGLFKLVIYATPIAMMLTGISPVKEFTWTLFALTMVYMTMSLYGVRAMSGGYGSIVYGELFAMVNFWTQIRGLSRAIFWRKFQQFVVTSKRGRQSNSIWPYIRPQAALFAFSFLALTWGWGRILYGISDDFFKPIIPTVWLVFHMMLASMAIRRSMWPDDGRFSFRHAVNVACRYESADGTRGYGVTIDLNELGSGLVGFRPVAKGEVLNCEFEGGGELVKTRATVMWIVAASKGKLLARGSNPVGVPQAYRIGVRFDPLPGRVFDAVNRITLQYGVPRLYQEYAEGNKQSAWRLLARRLLHPFGTGRIDPRRGYKLPMQVRTADGRSGWTVTEDLSPTAVAALLPRPIAPSSDVELTMLSPVGEVSGHAKVLRATRGVIGAREYWRTVLEFRHLIGDGPNTIQNLISRQASRVMHDALVPDPKPLPVPTLKPATYSALVATAIIGGMMVAFPLVYRDEIFLRALATRPADAVSKDDVVRYDDIVERTRRQGYPSNDRLVLLVQTGKKVGRQLVADDFLKEISFRDPRNAELQKTLVQLFAKSKNYDQAEATYNRLRARADAGGRLSVNDRKELLLAGARVAWGRGEAAVGVERFRNYLAEFGDDLAARNELAGHLIEARKLTEVPPLYDKVNLTHAAHPPAPNPDADAEEKLLDPVYDARVLLMSAYAIDQKAAEAQEEADHIRRLRPNDPAALAVIAGIKAAANDLEGARQDFERQVAQTGDPAIRVQLAQVYQAIPGPAGASKAFEQYQLAYDGETRKGSGVPYRSEALSRGIIDAAAGLDNEAFAKLTPRSRATLAAVEAAADPGPVWDDPTFLLRSAWVQERLQNVDRAAALLSRAKSLAPDNPEVRQQLFGMLVAQGKVQEALGQMSGGRDDPAVRQMLIDAYLRLEEFDRAELEARELSRAAPNDAVAKVQLADILSWNGKNPRPAEAAALFRELEPKTPSTPYPHAEGKPPLNQYVEKRLAECLLWAKETAASLAQYEKLLTRPRPGAADPFNQPDLWPGFVDAAADAAQLTEGQRKIAVRLARQESVLGGPNSLLLTRLGWVLTHAKQADIARPILARAYEVAAQEKGFAVRRELAGVLAATGEADFGKSAVKLYDPIPLDQRGADDYKRLADIYASLKMWPQAQTQANLYAKALPGDLRAERLQADILNWSEQYKEALPRYLAIQKVEPNNPEIALRVAQVNSRMGDYSQAVDLFTPLLDKKFPESAEALEGFIEVAGAAPELKPSQKQSLVRAITQGEFQPNDAAKLGRLAWAAHKVGLAEQANAAAARAVDLKPTDEAVQKQLGGTLAALKKFDLALKLFAPVALQPEDKLQLADIYSATDDFKKAIETLKQHLRGHPADLRAQVKLADVLAYDGQYPESLALYEKVRKSPNFARNLSPADQKELPVKAAEATLWAGNPGAAIQALAATLRAEPGYGRAWGPFIDAAARLPELTKPQKEIAEHIFTRTDLAAWDDAGRLGRLALVLKRVGRDADSRAAYARAQELIDKPARDAVNAKPAAASRRELALALAESGDPRGALELFRGLVLTDDDRHTVASLHLAAGDAAGAEAEVRELLDRNPNDPRAERLMAEVLAAKKDGRGAIEILDRLLKANGSDGELALRAAGILLELGEPGLALARYAAALEHQPDSPGARKGFVDAAGAAEALTPDQLLLAVKIAEEPATYKSTDPIYLGRLAWVLIRAGLADDGARLLDRVARILPTKPHERRELSGTFAAAGRTAEALKLFGEPPQTPEEHLQFANIQAALQDFERACAEVRLYLKEKPDDAKAKRLLADCLSWNGDFDESLILLEELARAEPGNAGLALRVAEVMLWSGRANEALERFAALASADGFVAAALEADALPPPAPAFAERRRAELLAAPEKDALRLARLGAVFAKYGRADAAKEPLDRAVADSPSLPPPARREVAALLDVSGRADDGQKLLAGLPFDADAMAKQAQVYVTARRFPKAAELARELLARQPADRKAGRLLADALAYDQKRPEAVAEYRKLLAAAPGDAGLTVRLARTLAETGDAGTAEAETILRDRLAPEPSRLLLARALLDVVVGPEEFTPDDTKLLNKTLQDAPMLLKVRDAGTLAKLGRALVALGRAPEANRAFDEAVRRLPRDAGVRQAVALTLASAGRAEQALELLRDPAAGAVESPLLVYLYTARKEWAEAEKAARLNLAAKPGDRKARRLFADVLAWSGQTAPALAAFAELAKDDPADRDIPIRVAETRLWAGDAAGALADFARLLGADFQQPTAWPGFVAAASRVTPLSAEVEALARQVAAKLAPESLADPAQLARLAKLLDVLGMRAEAEKALDRASALPLADAGARREVAGALAALNKVAEARELMKGATEPTFGDRQLLAGLLAAERDWPAAEVAVRALLKERPDHPEVQLQLADVLLGKKDVAAAMPILRAALEANPRDIPVALQYANGLVQSGDAERAAELYGQLLERDPRNPRARVGFVDAAAVAKFLRMREIRRVMRLLDDPELLKSAELSYVWRLAWVAIREGVNGKINAMLDRALQNPPTELELRRELAGVLASAGRGAEGLRLFGDLQAHKSQDHYDLANIYASLKDFEPAIREAKLFLDKNPGDAKALRLLADLHSYNRDFDEALAEFARLRAALPNDKSVPIRIAECTLWSNRPNSASLLFAAILNADADQSRAVPGFVASTFEAYSVFPEALAAADKVRPILTASLEAVNAPGALAGGLAVAARILDETEPLLLVRLAYVFHRAGEREIADRLFARAVAATQADDTRARSEVGTVLEVAGRADDARRLLDGLPFNAEDRYQTALIYTGLKSYGRAAEVCRETVAREPSHRKSERLLADALTWDKQYAAGLERLQKLLRENPNDPDLPTRIAQTLVWAGRPLEAARIYYDLLLKEPGKPKLYRGLVEAAFHLDPVPADIADGLKVAYRDSPFLRQIPESEYNAKLGKIFLGLGMPAEGTRHLEAGVRNLPDRAVVAREEVAKALAAVGRPDDAIALYRREPRLPADLLQVAYLYGNSGNWAAAERAARDFLRATPGDFEGRRFLADALAASGQHRAALALFAELTAEQPKNFTLRRRAAETVLATGDAAGALGRFAALLREAPADEPARDGFLGAAAAVLTLTPDQREQATKLLDSLDLKTAGNASRLARAARVFGRLNRPADARAALDFALKIPSLSADARRELAGALALFGRADEGLALYKDAAPDAGDRATLAGLYSSVKNWAEAEKLVRALLIENPDDPANLRQLAEVLGGKGDHDAALALFEKLRAAEPGNAELAVRTADAYLGAGRAAPALAIFAGLLQSEWGFEPARRGFANAAAAVRRMTRDQIALAAKLAAEPGTLEADDAVYLARLALALFRDGRPEVARPLLDRAVALAPAEPAARRELAGVLASAGRAKEALKLFGGKATTPEDRLRLAGIYAALKQWPDAVRVIDEYLADKPGDFAGRRMLADLYSWGGRHDEAVALFEKLLESEPNNADIPHRIAETLLWSGRAPDALDRLTRLLAAEPDRPGVAETFVAAAFEVPAPPPASVKVLKGLAARAADLKSNPLRLAQLGYLLVRAGRKEPGNDLLTQAAALAAGADGGARREVAAVLTLAGRTIDAAELVRGLPDEPADLLRAAAVYQAARAYSQAITIYRGLLAGQPDSAQFKRLLADALSGGQQFGEAIRLFRELVAENPDDRGLALRLAESLLYGGAAGEALRVFDAMLAVDPADPRLAAGFLQAAGELPRLTPGEKERVLQLYRESAPTLRNRPALFLVRFARALLVAGRPEEAAELFAHAAANPPRLPQDRRELSGLLSSAGRYDEAARLLEGLPPDADDDIRRAYIHLGQGQKLEAIRAARANAAAKPGDAAAERLLADVLSWTGEHTEALDRLRKLSAADASDRSLKVRIAQVRLWSRDRDGAAAAFFDLLKEAPGDADALDGFAAAVSAVSAGDGAPPPAAHLDLAEKLAQAMAPAELDANPLRAARLAAALQRANRPFPIDIPARAAAIAPANDDARRELVGILATLGRKAEALALFRQIHQEADDAQALAWLFVAANDPAAALKVANDAVAARPNDPSAVRLLADLLAAQKNYKGAAEQYQKLLLLIPNDPKAQAQLAAVLLGSGDYAAAAARLEPLAAKNPAAVKEYVAPFFAALANLDRERITREMQQTALRIADADAAKASDSVPFLTDAAWALDKMGARDLGEKYLDRAVGLNPTTPEERKTLSGVLEVFGRTDDALKMLEGLTLTEADHFRMAGLYSAQHKYDEAEAQVRTILAQNPDSQEARRLLADVMSWNSRYEPTEYKESLELFEKLLAAGYVDPRKPPRPTIPVRIAQVTLWGKRYDAAAEKFRDLLNANFEQPALWPSYVDALSSAKQPVTLDGQLAARVYERIFVDKVPPQAVYGDARQTEVKLEFLSRLAWVLQKFNRKESVAALVELALACEPANENERRELAGVLAAVGRYREARKLYEGIAAEFLQWADLMNMARIDSAAQDFAAAERRLRAALAARPREPSLQLMLADVLIWRKDTAGALRVLQELRRSAPNDPAVEGKIATAYAYSPDAAGPATALPLFVRSLTRDPEQKALWQPFLDAVAATPRPSEEVRRLVDRVAVKMERLAVDDPELYASLGPALGRVGRSQQAITGMERALALRPESDVLRRRYAETLDLLYRTQEAKRQWDILLEKRERRRAAERGRP